MVTFSLRQATNYNLCVPSTRPSARSKVPRGRCPALSEKPSEGRDRNSLSAASRFELLKNQVLVVQQHVDCGGNPGCVSLVPFPEDPRGFRNRYY